MWILCVLVYHSGSLLGVVLPFSLEGFENLREWGEIVSENYWHLVPQESEIVNVIYTMHRAASHNELFHPKYQYCSLSEPRAPYLYDINDEFLPPEVEGILGPELGCIFVKFHFDSLSRGILCAFIAPCSLGLFFFFAKFKYNWTVHLILLFGPNLWQLLFHD